jgi:3-deoxy-manno-octulosonate cytidylyltransferase (CMP-KDO synthetase)
VHEVVGSPARAVIVIPARLESRRFARKVLARETGKFLIQHVWEEVLGTPRVERVIVATDSDEVAAAARSFGAETRLTSAEHLSGTDRVAEVVRELDEDIVINVQGDEPSVCRDDLARLVEALERPPSAGGVTAPATSIRTWSR